MKDVRPPEVADGGYWYVVPIVIDTMGGMEGARTAGGHYGVGWSAWYGTNNVVIRCPKPATGMTVADSETVDEVLAQAGYTRKPYGRIGGL